MPCARIAGLLTFSHALQPKTPMRASQFHLFTLKEAPSDAEVVSQKLMLRAGMIRKTAAGIYTTMPLGLRTMNKIEGIVREEMDAAGSQQLRMPIVLPAEPWKATGRYDAYGDLMFRLNGISLTVPPLRERPEDVAPLARRFLAQAARAAGRRPPRLSAEALGRISAVGGEIAVTVYPATLYAFELPKQ